MAPNTATMAENLRERQVAARRVAVHAHGVGAEEPRAWLRRGSFVRHVGVRYGASQAARWQHLVALEDLHTHFLRCYKVGNLRFGKKNWRPRIISVHKKMFAGLARQAAG